MGSDYWGHIQKFIRETMIDIGAISPEDLDLMFITDDPAEGVNYIKRRLDEAHDFTRSETFGD